MTDKPTLSERSKAALNACFATRGKNKGRLLSKAPAWDKAPDAHAAWHGAMICANPFKSGVFAAMWIGYHAEQAAIYNEVKDYLDARPHLARELDSDRANLSRLGVW